MKGISRFKASLLANQKSLDVHQETFRNIVTGQIYMMMLSSGITKKSLADRLKVSKPAVTSLLSGERNLTIDKISEISYNLDCIPQFRLIRKSEMYKERLKAAWVYIEKSESHLKVYDIINKKKVEFHEKRDRTLAAFVEASTNKVVMESYVTE